MLPITCICLLLNLLLSLHILLSLFNTSTCPLSNLSMYGNSLFILLSAYIMSLLVLPLNHLLTLMPSANSGICNVLNLLGISVIIYLSSIFSIANGAIPSVLQDCIYLLSLSSTIINLPSLVNESPSTKPMICLTFFASIVRISPVFIHCSLHPTIVLSLFLAYPKNLYSFILFETFLFS